MSATLLEMEKEVLEEGREWTRRRLQERLQEAADRIPAVCGQSGLVLKRQQETSFTLMTVSGTVTIAAIRGHSKATGGWHCPVREQWGLAKWARLSPEFEQRLAYNGAVAGSFQKGAELSRRWGSPISDDAIHALVQRLAENNNGVDLPASPPPKPREPAFSLVIMIDGWMVRQRGVDWGAKPGVPALERVSWKEVKSAVVYRLEDRAANAPEIVLAGLSACLTGTLAYHSAARGLNIESIESEYEGDIDLHGFLGLDPSVRPGFREIRVKFRVKGDADEATIRELLGRSPIYDTLANPVKIKIEVEKV